MSKVGGIKVFPFQWDILVNIYRSDIKTTMNKPQKLHERLHTPSNPTNQPTMNKRVGRLHGREDPIVVVFVKVSSQ